MAVVPVLDLRLLDGSEQDKQHCADVTRRAFQGPGMLIVEHTGVPQSTIDETVRVSKAFFDLPVGRKGEWGEGFAADPKVDLKLPYPGRTWSLQRDYTDAEGQQRIVNEWLLCRESTSHPRGSGDGEYFGSMEGELHFREPTPETEGPDPPEAAGLRLTLEEYHREMQMLAKKVERCFALALDLPEDFFEATSSRAPSWPVTIAHYPKQRLEAPPPVERIDPHWDRVMFSLVTTTDEAAQQNGGGIQILLDEHGDTVDAGTGTEGHWHDVPVRSGQFCINIGEIMTQWTNRVFKHVVHRVTNPTTPEGNTDRISLMAYVAPDYPTRIDRPLPGCLAEEETQLYEPTWVGEMMNWEAGRGLGIYNEEKQDRMRRAQGLYTVDGKQVGADEEAGTGLPTDVSIVDAAANGASMSKL